MSYVICNLAKSSQTAAKDARRWGHSTVGQPLVQSSGNGKIERWDPDILCGLERAEQGHSERHLPTVTVDNILDQVGQSKYFTALGSHQWVLANTSGT